MAVEYARKSFISSEVIDTPISVPFFFFGKGVDSNVSGK